MSHSLGTSRARLRALVTLTAALVCVVAAPAHAAQTPLTVQTQNLYLGADLTPALNPANNFFVEANKIWNTVKASNPAARMGKIADEINTANPDIVALQEVSKWTVTNITASEQSLDFLALLQSALTARGLQYDALATSDNANIPDPSLPFPGIPLPSPAGPSFFLRFQDRDVILVKRNRPGLTCSPSSPAHGNYATQLTLPSPIGGPDLSFNRGWASVTCNLSGRSFHFVDTHLETESPAPAVQVAQGNEFLAGPTNVPGTVIAAGDFNSAADGSTTATYRNLTAVLKDAWINGNQQAPGFSCCQAADLLNTLSTLHERIDLVLTKNAAATPAPKAKLVNDRQVDRAATGQWASDHAGLVATVFP